MIETSLSLDRASDTVLLQSFTLPASAFI